MGLLMYPAFSCAQDIRGDVNGDLEVNIADINHVIDIILEGNGNTPAADVNGDGEINIADINVIIDIILSGGAPTPDSHEYVDLGLPSGTLWQRAMWEPARPKNSATTSHGARLNPR